MAPEDDQRDDGEEAPGLRKIIHVDMDAFYATMPRCGASRSRWEDPPNGAW
jgi:hypothetical protein